MPWCPVCKNEYVEGIKVCADCNVELTDSLKEEGGSPLIFGEKEQMERLLKFLEYSEIHTARLAPDEEDGVYELFVSKEDRKKASVAVGIFLQQEGKEKLKDILPEDEKGIPGYPLPAPTSKSIYENSAKRAEENRSSGYMLLAVGGIGLAAVILIFMGIIPISMGTMNRYMTCGVMSGLFILFIVMGILSMKSSKVLAQKAEKENNLTSEIKKWCEENLRAEEIDAGLFEAGNTEAEEIKYFKRTEKMKSQIAYQFLNLDEGFLDSFVDDYYPNVFE